MLDLLAIYTGVCKCREVVGPGVVQEVLCDDAWSMLEKLNELKDLPINPKCYLESESEDEMQFIEHVTPVKNAGRSSAMG